MVRVRRGASRTLASVQPTRAERERRSARGRTGVPTRPIPRPVFVSAAFGGAGSRAGRSVIRASVRRQRVFPRKTTGARGRKPVRTGGGRLVGIGTTIGTRRPTRLKSVRKAPTIRVLGVRKVRKKSRRRPRLEVRKKTGARGRRPVRRRGGKLIRVSAKPFRRPRLVKVTSPSRGKARTIRVSSRSRLARKKRVRRPTRRPIRKTKPKVRPARAITRVLGTRVIQRRRTRKPRKLRVVRGARGKVKRVKTKREVIRVSTRPRGQRLRIVRGARGRVRRIGFTPPPRRSLRANPLTSLFAGQLPQGRRRIGSDFDVLSGF